MSRAILASAALTVALGVAASPAPAAAKGCLKGALVGGVERERRNRTFTNISEAKGVNPAAAAKLREWRRRGTRS